ncbi:hypothetical protein A33M_3836 [Rhodovulum sp. PH10]|nr:hypothetical protein A33M_3836 [Rhodovulum sp. PH10]
MNLVRRDHGAAQRVAQVAGRGGAGDHRRLDAEIDRAARRRLDAHVGHEAGEHHRRAVQRMQAVGEVGAGKGVRQALGEHRLAGRRRRRRDDLHPTGAGGERAAAALAVMHHVDHRHRLAAGEGEQPAELVERRIDARERQRAVDIFVLGVDHHDHGVGEADQGRRRAGELEQGFGGHRGLHSASAGARWRDKAAVRGLQPDIGPRARQRSGARGEAEGRRGEADRTNKTPENVVLRCPFRFDMNASVTPR